MTRARRAAATMLVCACVSGACGRETPRPSPARPPTPDRTMVVAIDLPAFEKADAALRERLQLQRAAVARVDADTTATDRVRADAYASFGKLLLAADFIDAAAGAFANARRLSSSDWRWAYYSAHAYRLGNRPQEALSAFDESIRLNADHVPSLVWRARLLVDDGRAADAKPLLERALQLQPRSAAALFETGRVAVAQRQYAAAIAPLDAAQAADPSSSAPQYSLATAYRGLGDARSADAHLRRWKEGESEVLPADPLMDEVGRLLQTAIDFTVRGVQALDRRKLPEAIALFRQGLEIAPADPVLHLNLGTALYLSGDADAALSQFQDALRVSPAYARAHFVSGVLFEERGQDAAALAQFEAAVRDDATFVDARFSLADALRRAGRVAEALPHYLVIVRADPGASQARFGYAMGLVRLGRYREARDALEEAMTAHPGQPGIVHALARVLAAAPDDQVRDGRRARALLEPLRAQFRSATLSETWAMAQAELGQFDQAVASQRNAMADARGAGQDGLVRVLAENLALYEGRRPCRQPWRDDDPVHAPRAGSAIRRF